MLTEEILTEVVEKRYIGTRMEDHGVVVMIHEPGKPRPLNPRYDLVNRSPDGFEWGYGGSGPAQLAIAILADAIGDDDWAKKHYQKFKWDFVTRFAHGHWSLSWAAIDAWVRAMKLSEDAA